MYFLKALLLYSISLHLLKMFAHYCMSQVGTSDSFDLGATQEKQI